MPSGSWIPQDKAQERTGLPPMSVFGKHRLCRTEIFQPHDQEDTIDTL